MRARADGERARATAAKAAWSFAFPPPTGSRVVVDLRNLYRRGRSDSENARAGERPAHRSLAGVAPGLAQPGKRDFQCVFAAFGEEAFARRPGAQDSRAGGRRSRSSASRTAGWRILRTGRRCPDSPVRPACVQAPSTGPADPRTGRRWRRRSRARWSSSRSTRPRSSRPGRTTRRTSAKKASCLNQWNAWATVLRSADAASTPVASAVPRRYSTFGAGVAFARWSSLGSTPITRSKWRASATAACPFPVPTSTASL